RLRERRVGKDKRVVAAALSHSQYGTVGKSGACPGHEQMVVAGVGRATDYNLCSRQTPAGLDSEQVATLGEPKNKTTSLRFPTVCDEDIIARAQGSPNLKVEDVLP